MTHKVRRLFNEFSGFYIEMKGSIKEQLIELGYDHNVRFRKINSTDNRTDYRIDHYGKVFQVITL